MLVESKRPRGQRDIAMTAKRGKEVRGAYYHIKSLLQKSTAPVKIAVVVGKKTAKNATTRNRIKRRTREALRRVFVDFSGYNIVVMPKKNVERAPFSTLTNELKAYAHNLARHQ